MKRREKSLFWGGRIVEISVIFVNGISVNKYYLKIVLRSPGWLSGSVLA